MRKESVEQSDEGGMKGGDDDDWTAIGGTKKKEEDDDRPVCQYWKRGTCHFKYRACPHGLHSARRNKGLTEEEERRRKEAEETEKAQRVALEEAKQRYFLLEEQERQASVAKLIADAEAEAERREVLLASNPELIHALEANSLGEEEARRNQLASLVAERDRREMLEAGGVAGDEGDEGDVMTRDCSDLVVPDEIILEDEMAVVEEQERLKAIKTVSTGLVEQLEAALKEVNDAIARHRASSAESTSKGHVPVFQAGCTPPLELARRLLNGGASLKVLPNEFSPVALSTALITEEAPSRVLAEKEAATVLTSGRRSKKSAPRRRVATPPREKGCVICLDAVADVQVLPCRHTAYCVDCVVKLEDCALCRSNITSYKRLRPSELEDNDKKHNTGRAASPASPAAAPLPSSKSLVLIENSKSTNDSNGTSSKAKKAKSPKTPKSKKNKRGTRLLF